MIDPDVPEPPPVEGDARFPSGPWKGFFLQPHLPGKHWMELRITFRGGRLSGDGRDWVGRFVLSGRYDVDDGKCHWTKAYVGKHDIFYQGYNEGKGIWGRWEWPRRAAWHGGFHIWPVGQGFEDPTALHEALDVPVAEAVGAGESMEI